VAKRSLKYVHKIRYTYTNILHANFYTYDLRCYNKSYHLPAIKDYFNCAYLSFFILIIKNRLQDWMEYTKTRIYI